MNGFKGSCVAVTLVGSCMVGARFGKGVMINGFKGVEVVTAVTAVGFCIVVGKLSSKQLAKPLFE